MWVREIDPIISENGALAVTGRYGYRNWSTAGFGRGIGTFLPHLLRQLPV
jgi:hypothetical protein